MKLEKGDLVGCYLLNSSLDGELLIQHGIVLSTNPTLEDVLVIDNDGHIRWWSAKRWRIIKKVKKTS
jgi:hypothetical protein